MKTHNIFRHLPIGYLIGTAFLFCISFSFAQPALPNKAITVQPTQPIHFGTFCVTGALGGTVTVGYDGSRSSTGDIILINQVPLHQPAIFEIKLCQGRNVAIEFDATTTLSKGSGDPLILEIGPTERGRRFVTNSDCNFITPLRVGGTLRVPGTAQPGIYTGSFAINFIQQ